VPDLWVGKVVPRVSGWGWSDQMTQYLTFYDCTPTGTAIHVLNRALRVGIRVIRIKSFWTMWELKIGVSQI